MVFDHPLKGAVEPEARDPGEPEAYEPPEKPKFNPKVTPEPPIQDVGPASPV